MIFSRNLFRKSHLLHFYHTPAYHPEGGRLFFFLPSELCANPCFARIRSRLGRAANRLTRLDAILFPFTIFFASGLILLSPKRAMRQSVLRTDTQPLGTGRQPLDAVGRDSFPIHHASRIAAGVFLFTKLCRCVSSRKRERARQTLNCRHPLDADERISFSLAHLLRAWEKTSVQPR